jgi:hypothetical protein
MPVGLAAKVVMLRLAWGPGAGVEAAGGLCLSRNEAGVVCIPKHTGGLHHRKRQLCRAATVQLRTREAKVVTQEPPWFFNLGESVTRPEGANQC